MHEIDKLETSISKKGTGICLVTGCNCVVSNNHVLQKNGILNFILDDTGHCVIPKRLSLFKRHNEIPFNIAPAGKEEALVFRGLCSNHDHDIFASIEKVAVDLSNHNNILKLLSRALYAELATLHELDEFSRRYNELLLGSGEGFYAKYLSDGKDFRQDCWFYINEIERSIQEESVFTTSHKILPKIDIAFCSVIVVEENYEEQVDEYENAIYEPYPMGLVALIPQENKSIFLSAVHNKYKSGFVNSVAEQIDTSNCAQIIDHLITHNVDRWAMSTRLYRKVPSDVWDRYKLEAASSKSFQTDTSIRK